MSAYTSLQILLPEYTNSPAPMDRKKALNYIIRGRLNLNNSKGNGNKFRKRLNNVKNMIIRNSFHAK